MFFLSIVLYTKLIEIGLDEFNFLSFSYYVFMYYYSNSVNISLASWQTFS